MAGKSNGKRALVTGGAGLIGSHLTDLLPEEGYGVRILDNPERGVERHMDRIATRGDVRDYFAAAEEALRGSASSTPSRPPRKPSGDGGTPPGYRGRVAGSPSRGG